MTDDDRPQESWLARLETKTEEIALPAVSVSVAFDLNDYLDGHTEAEAFDLIGKLKDLLAAPPVVLPPGR